MHVMILGAGLLGVTSAYYLQQLGHDVTVVDRHAQPAANALGRERGLSDAAQAATEALMRAAGDARRRSPLRPVRAGLHRCLDVLPGWLARRGDVPGAEPGVLMEDLYGFSRRTVRALRGETAVPPPGRGSSVLRFYTDARAFADAARRQPRLQALGCERLLLSAGEAMRIEPLLRPLEGRLAGATLARGDHSGDASGFAAELVFLCRAAGVRFLTRHTVVALRHQRGRIAQVDAVDAHGEHCELRADAYLLALGPASVRHAREVGMDLPLRFVREYSLQIPAYEEATLPGHALSNLQDKGFMLQRRDLAGAPAVEARSLEAIDLAGPLEPKPEAFTALRDRAKTLMPGGLDTCRARLHSRVLALSTHGLPLIGRTPLPNLFLNTAPGRLDWVGACGAGKAIAHIVTGLRPEVAFAFTGM